MTHYRHELHDGRHLGVTGLGDPDATRLVLFCHPSPGVGGFDPDPTLTATVGVRIVALDRPGYGGSDPMRDTEQPVERWIADLDGYLHTVESNARTVSTIDFGQIGVIGWGTGAIFAAALAGRQPQLVQRLALIEPTAPLDERVQDSDAWIDRHLEQIGALQQLGDHPGAGNRMGLMLDEATHGDVAGLDFDRRALTDRGWHPLLANITAPTLIITAGGGSDEKWYRHRIASTERSSGWSKPSTTIVEAWPQILDFMKPNESEQGARFSRRRGSSPFPQVSQRPR